jgi:hypothetical protein
MGRMERDKRSDEQLRESESIVGDFDCKIQVNFGSLITG